MNRLTVAAVLMLAAASPVAAQDDPADCASPETQSAMNACAGLALSAADDALNAAYKRAMSTMQAIDADLPADDQGAAMALRAAQRAWIPYRDEACKAEGFLVHGGSMEPLTVLQCRARLTEARTADLAELLRAE